MFAVKNQLQARDRSFAKDDLSATGRAGKKTHVRNALNIVRFITDRACVPLTAAFNIT